jgi:xylan 1,4-beta-xylosidase
MGGKSIGSADSYAATRHLREKGPNRTVRHSIAGLEPGTAFLVEVLDWEHGNVAEAWYQMGSPVNLSREEARHLGSVADALLRYTLTVPETGVLDLDLDLSPWAVVSVRQSN